MSLVLVDTNVWISHFRRENEDIVELLNEDRVLVHPFVQGEIACGWLKNRKEILRLLSFLPQAESVSAEEVFSFIEAQKIYGTGLGIVDVYLLASCRLSNAKLWTCDKILLKTTKKLNLAF